MKARPFITLDGRMKRFRRVYTRSLRRSKHYGSGAWKLNERGVDLTPGGPEAPSGISPSLGYSAVSDAGTPTTGKQS